MFFIHKNGFSSLLLPFSISRFIKSNLSILFYGSNKFSLPSLQALHSNLILPHHHQSKIIHSIDICSKSTQNEIGNYSINNNLNLILWPYKVPLSKYDIGVVVSFGELIPKQSIDACSKGILNAHASLLPKLRGAAPVFRAILNDYKETGVTIMSIKADRFDVGDIIIQEKVKIEEDTKAIELYEELSKLSADLLMKCLGNLDYYLKNSTKQNEELATRAPKIKEGENRIYWNRMDLKTVYKMYRAFDGFVSIYTTWTNGCEMKLHQMINMKKMLEIQNELNKEFEINDLYELQPGAIKYSKRKKIICIKCKDSNWAGFKEISLKGHQIITSNQFNNGFLLGELRKCKQPIVGE